MNGPSGNLRVLSQRHTDEVYNQAAGRGILIAQQGQGKNLKSQIAAHQMFSRLQKGPNTGPMRVRFLTLSHIRPKYISQKSATGTEGKREKREKYEDETNERDKSALQSQLCGFSF